MRNPAHFVRGFVVITMIYFLRMTDLAGSHAPIDCFLTAGKINTVAFVHFPFPLTALIMEFPAVAVTDIGCRVHCHRNGNSNSNSNDKR